MKTPRYVGRRVDGHARLFYVGDSGEADITYLLQRAGITFATRLDWHGTGSELAELAQTMLWHATRSHELTFRWGRLLAWDLLAFLEDGWHLDADALEDWLRERVQGRAPGTGKGNGTPR